MEFLAGFGGCTGIDHGGLDRDYSMPYAIGVATHAKWSVVNDNDHSGTRGEEREHLWLHKISFLTPKASNLRTSTLEP